MSGPSMTCAKCGTEMNHHADKLVDPLTREEAAAMTSVIDGVLMIVFACPNCGWIDSRRGSQSQSQHS